MKAGVKIGLWLVIIGLSYLVYNSITSKIAFEDETKRRREIVVPLLAAPRLLHCYPGSRTQRSGNGVCFGPVRPRIAAGRWRMYILDGKMHASCIGGPSSQLAGTRGN